MLAPLILAEPRRHWVGRLSEAGIPCGEIKSVGEVCEAPQLVDRGQVGSCDHPTAGPVRYVGSAIRFGDAPAPAASPPPRLGEHTRDVLVGWLGLDEDELDGLAQAGAFGRAAPVPDLPA